MSNSNDAGQRHRPHDGMKCPVSRCVLLEPGKAGRRTTAGGTDHVVPLQELVKDDPVDEASEADTHQEARDDRRPLQRSDDIATLGKTGG
jgi:hypothetical protein